MLQSTIGQLKVILTLSLFLFGSLADQVWGEASHSDLNIISGQTEELSSTLLCGTLVKTDKHLRLVQSSGKSVRLVSSNTSEQSKAQNLEQVRAFFAHLDGQLCFVNPHLTDAGLDIFGYTVSRVSKNGEALIVEKFDASVKPQIMGGSTGESLAKQKANSEPVYQYNFSQSPSENPLIFHMRNYPGHYGVISGKPWTFDETRGSTLFRDRFKRTQGMQLENWVRDRMMSGKGPFPSESLQPATKTWGDFYQEHIYTAEREQGQGRTLVEDDGPYSKPVLNPHNDSNVSLFLVKAPKGTSVIFPNALGNYMYDRTLSHLKSNKAEQFGFAVGSGKVKSQVVRVEIPNPKGGEKLVLSTPLLEVPAGQRVMIEFKLSSDGKPRLLWW